MADEPGNECNGCVERLWCDYRNALVQHLEVRDEARLTRSRENKAWIASLGCSNIQDEPHPSNQELLVAADRGVWTRHAARVRAHIGQCWPCRMRVLEQIEARSPATFDDASRWRASVARAAYAG